MTLERRNAVRGAWGARLCLGVLAFAGWCAGSGVAAEPAKPSDEDAARREAGQLYIRCETPSFDFARGVALLVGNVRFAAPRTDMLIAADAAVIWLAQREAYLEGNVRIYKTLGKPLKPGDCNVPKPNLTDRTGLEPEESLEPAGDLDDILGTELREAILIDTRAAVSEAERVYVNWSDGTAYILKPTFRMVEAERIANWTVTAPSAEGIATYDVPVFTKDGKFTGRYEKRRHFVLRNATFTVCSFKDPHTRITSTYAEHIDGEYTAMHNMLIEIGEVPVFYFPYLWKDLEYDWPWTSLDLGTSSRLGFFADYRIGFKPVEHVWVKPRVEYMSKRGVALGLGADYRFGQEREIRGALDVFWLAHDRGKDALARTGREGSGWPAGWPAELGPLPDSIPLGETQRYRFKFVHQQEYPAGVEIDLELHKFSDAGVYREYFEKEFKTEKPPEPHLLVKYGRDNWAAFIQVSRRLDDFLTQTEYLPQLGFNLIAQPVGGGLLFSTDTELAYVRTRYGDVRQRLGQSDLDITRLWLRRNEYSRPPALTLRQNDTDGLAGWRFDTLNTLSYPFEVSVFDIEPYVGWRGSWFQRGMSPVRSAYAGAPPPLPLPGEVADAPTRTGGVLRSQFLAGARAATQFHRTYDVTDSPFLRQYFPNGMRHIITPEVTYTFEGSPSAKPNELPENDAVTEQWGLHKINLALRNRLQTRWAPPIERIPGAPPGGEWYRRKLAAEAAKDTDPVDVVDLDMDIDLFLDPSRDNAYPRGKRVRHWSNLRTDLTVKTGPKTTLFCNTEYSFESHAGDMGGLEVMSTGVAYKPRRDVVYSASYDYHFDDASLLRLAADWDVNPRWRLRFDLQQALSRGGEKGGRWDQSLEVTRRFHEWQITLGYGFDRGKDESYGILRIGPSAKLPQPPSWWFQPRSVAAFQLAETAR